jgi:hypothetical protein
VVRGKSETDNQGIHFLPATEEQMVWSSETSLRNSSSTEQKIRDNR